jgi:hypothetical protein
MKIFAQISLVLVFLFVTAKFASASPITFGIDCMIHDNQGKMLSDLGAVGNVMGDYLATENFTYNGLHIRYSSNSAYCFRCEWKSTRLIDYHCKRKSECGSSDSE